MTGARKFGWFAGVFTPSILTILGVIMYLRLPAIVGQAGLITTLGIIGLAHVISITTGLSVASVATDKKVEGGGTYYMISRSLGLSMGGTLGVALYVGLSFAVSLYIVGFAESFLGVWGFDQSVTNVRVLGTVVLVAVTTLTFISTTLALRTQFFVLTAIALSLLSIVAGVGRHEHVAAAPVVGSLPEAAPFIALFAIFFPAVTGFEAGVSMSGDLRDPKRALPLGSLSAILVGLAVYVALAAFLALTVSAEALAWNPNVLTEIAWVGPLVLAGVWGATLSSALGSILGAPRILQATSVDRITPRFFAPGSGRAKEPRRALVVTFFIAWIGILIGELDSIARVVSMFFIATYGFLNLSCAIESWASPDFRPALRVPRLVSVIGALACLVVMIQLDVVAMLGATLVLGALYFLLARKQLRLESGDAWEGLWASVARTALHRLDRSPPHKRNWRPNILLFAGPEGGRPHLLEFGQELAGRRGMVTNFHLIERPELGDQTAGIEAADLDGEEPPYGVFTRRVECADVYEGMADVARYYGYSGVEPNSVLIGWPRRGRQEQQAAGMIRRFVDLDYNVLLLDHKADRGFGERRRVDFWVDEKSEHLGLMLALAGYLTSADQWRGAALRFLTVAGEGPAAGHTGARRLVGLLEAQRLDAEVRVVTGAARLRSMAELLATESGDADLTVLGLADVGGLRRERGIETATKAVDAVGSALLIHAGPDLRDSSVRSAPSRPPQERTPASAEPEPEPDPEPLTPPADPGLAADVTWLDSRMQECAVDCVDGPLAAAYAHHQRLSDRTARLIRQVRDQVKSLEGAEPARALREIRKTWGDFLFQSRRILSDYTDEGVPAQTDALDGVVDRLLDARERLVEDAHRTLRPADGRRVPWRALVRQHLGVRVPRAGMNVVYDLAVDSARALSDAQACLADAVAAIERLEDALEVGDHAHVAIAVMELDGVARLAGEGIAAGEASVRRPGAALRSGLRDAARRAGADAAKVAAGQRVRPSRRRRRAGDALAARLRQEPGIWGANQTLLTRTAGVELTLLAFEHRARTVVRRDLAELRLRIQNGVVARLDGVDQALAEYLDRAASDPEAGFGRTSEEWSLPSVEAFVGGIMTELGPATAELAEHTEIAADPSSAGGVAGRIVEAEGLEVALRSLVQLRLESDLVGGLREELADADQVLYRAEDTARDAVRLAAIGPGDTSLADGGGDPRVAMIQSARARLAAAREAVIELMERLDEAVARRMEETFRALRPHELGRSAARVPAYIRALRGREALSWFQRQRRRGRAAIAELMGRLLYQRSATLLAARDLERRDGHSPAAALPRLVAAVRPYPGVLAALPYHYRQIFLGKPAYARDFWMGWSREKELARAAVARHRGGQVGGMAIVGEPYGGKSALARYLADEFFDRNSVIIVAPVAERSTDPTVFLAQVRDAVGRAGHPVAIEDQDSLSGLNDAVVIVEDMDLWWERSDDGYGVIREILRLIRRHGDRILFLLVADAHAFRFIRDVEGLDAEFLTVIESGPFSAREIGAVIGLRHTSTGLVFEYGGRAEHELSAWRRARLFNRIFDYSRGGIGAALQTWIAHVRRVDGERLEVVAPSRPDLEPLDLLRPVQVLILVQLILHRKLDRDRLARLCPLDPVSLSREVEGLLRTGLLVEDRPGVIQLDPFVRPHLTAWCADRKLIP